MMRIHQSSESPSHGAARGILRRKCTCGGTSGLSGECAKCRNEQLQRKAGTSETTIPAFGVVDPIVNDVLRSPGRPLDADTRAFMEPRFEYSFDKVRVFAGPAADKAAQAVQARAYTYGHNVVFAAGEYAPGTVEGKKLLAHELTHVVQQSAIPGSETPDHIGAAHDPAEIEADRIADRVASSRTEIAGQIGQQRAGVISRQEKKPAANPVTCPAGVHGAPANAEQILDTVEVLGILATVVANAELGSLQLEIILPGVGAGGGYTMPTGAKIQNYVARFGLPPAAGAGKFRNRLSGATFPSQAQALAEEAKSLADRYSRIADFLGDSNIRFRCIDHKTTFGGCEADCSEVDAWGCPPNTILLCPKFWNLGPDEKAQLLIHEVAHTIFGILHGHNFSHADCYAAYAADARGRASTTKPRCVP